VRESTLQKGAFHHWKQYICTGKQTQVAAITTYHHNLMCKSTYSLAIAVQESREVRMAQRREEEQRAIDNRKYKAAAFIHDLSRSDRGLHKGSGTTRNATSARKDDGASDRDSVDDKENSANGSHEKGTTKKTGKAVARSVLGQRNSKARKVGEVKQIDRRNEKDEEERQAYLQKKREEKMRKVSQGNEMERLKKAWKLAKMHYSLSLLKRYFSVHWASYMQEQRLKELKAQMFWKDATMIACMRQFILNVESRKQHKLEVERRKFSQAGEGKKGGGSWLIDSVLTKLTNSHDYYSR